MGHQVLARKWRPRRFEEVVGQPHVVQALQNALNQQYLHHAYLFTGTRGVGKTTIARIIAKCLNCEQGISATPCEQCATCQEIDSGRFPDLFEVDAASRTKVEDTRELLDNVQYAPTKGRYKIYLIDEVHMLSGHSFNALLKTLEEPPEHVKFLLATTDPQRLPATVLSRCLQFHLLLMTPDQIANHLDYILTQEKLKYDHAANLLIGKAANGSMRDALSLTDQAIAFGNGKVLTDDVKKMLGTIEPTALFDILRALANKDATALIDAADSLSEQGANFSRALGELLSLLHLIALKQTVPNVARDDITTDVITLAEQLSAEDTQLFYQIGLLGQRDLDLAPTPRGGFEMILLRMLAFIPGSMAMQNHADMSAQTNSQHNNKQTNRQATQTPSQNATTNNQQQKVQHSQSQNRTANNQQQTPLTQKQPIDIPANVEWNTLCDELHLTGPTQMLAKHCSLKSIDNNHLHLALNPKQQAFLHKRHVDRIETALANQFNRPMKVTIDVEKTDIITPARHAELKTEQRQQAAQTAIMGDSDVQRLMNTFDATVVEGSIAPVEPITT